MGLDQEIRALLQALPTRTDIGALILRLEETHRRDIQEVRGEDSILTDWVTTGEESVTSLEARVLPLEQTWDQHRETAISLQLHLENVEDQSRRNNLRLRGIPESADVENIGAKMTEIFRGVLGDPEAVIKLDRAHRALGP